jgi:hypothetical protein
MQIALRKFDPASIDDTRICLIIGKRGTGKTILARDLLWHHRTIAAGICCSGTEDGNQWYQKFIPDSFVYSEFDKGAVERLVARQRSLRKKGVFDPVFLILDDCMYDRRIFREKVIRNLFYNGRHWAIFTLMTSQYMLDLGPDLRTNVDFVFILREPIRANRERLWKAFGGIFPTFEQFNAVMDAVTNEYGCLVIDNTSKSNKIEDVAFWYKANPNRNFKMGSAAFWRYHSARYDPKHDERPPNAAEENSKRVRVVKKR